MITSLTTLDTAFARDKTQVKLGRNQSVEFGPGGGKFWALINPCLSTDIVKKKQLVIGNVNSYRCKFLIYFTQLNGRYKKSDIVFYLSENFLERKKPMLTHTDLNFMSTLNNYIEKVILHVEVLVLDLDAIRKFFGNVNVSLLKTLAFNFYNINYSID